MRYFTTIALILGMFAVGDCAADNVAEPNNRPLPTDKLGPQVQSFLKTRQGGHLTVVLVGRSQLLEGAAGLKRFCREHETADRRELRREVIERLQEIATREQDKIISQLGDVSESRRLWIINAVWARLTPDQIRLAASLDEVGFIFVDWPVRKRLEPNRVEEILSPREETRFAPDDKVIPWDLYELGIPEVWLEFAVSGEGVVVAMAGQGANYLHDDIRYRIWINDGEIAENGRDDDANGFVDDIYGYDMAQQKSRVISRRGDQRGTWACGLVAGDGSGGTITGAAPQARLMLLKARGSHVAAMLAVQYAVANGADVMHLDASYRKLGSIRGVWRRTCEQAVCAGLVLVAGVPDHRLGPNTHWQMGTPEDIPCVLAVGGVAPDRELHRRAAQGPAVWHDVPSFKDWPPPDGLIKPDMVAFRGPGLRLLRGNDLHGYLPSDAPLSSNFFASARAAGVAALVLSARPALPAWKVRSILEETAVDLVPQGKDNRTGAGLINAYAAVRAVLELPDSGR